MALLRVVQSLMVILVLGTAPLPAATLRGVVQDEQGRPIADARVDIAIVTTGKLGMFNATRHPDCAKWTRTDRDGQYAFEDLEPHITLRVIATAPGKQSKQSEYLGVSSSLPKEKSTLVLEDFPADLPPNRLLEGTVVDQAGKPIAGAVIEPKGAKKATSTWWGNVGGQPAVSDDDGHFAMVLPADVLGMHLEVSVDGLAGTSTDLLQPGVAHRVTVPTGTSVTGQIVHEGQPQAGYPVAVVQENRNSTNHFIQAVLATTDHEGRFRFDALPASQVYAVFTPIGAPDRSSGPHKNRVLTSKKFACLADSETFDLGSLNLRDGLTLSGKVERPDGTPFEPRSKLLAMRNPAWDRIEIPILADGSFQVTGLPPETYEFLLQPKELVLDPNRLKFQTIRPNSFAMRLTKAAEQLQIPLMDSSPTAVASARQESILVEPKDAESQSEDLLQNDRGRVATGRRAPQLTEEPVADDTPSLRLRGSVVSSAGQRIEGAKVILRAKIQGSFYTPGITHDRDILARTTTDAQGRFLLGNVPIPRRMRTELSKLILGRGGADVLVEAEGYGLAAAEVVSLDGSAPLRIVLPAEAKVHGQVRDQDGQPVAQAAIELLGIASAVGSMNAFFNQEGETSFSLSQYRLTTTADAQGQFQFPRLPVNRRIMIAVSSPRLTRTVAIVDTSVRPNKFSPLSVKVQNTDYAISRSPLDVRMASSTTVEVHVQDDEGMPVKTGYLEIRSPKFGAHHELNSPDGIAIIPIPSAGECQFTYASDPLMPTACKTVIQQVAENADRQRIDIRLPATRWLTGRVLDQESGKPIVGAHIRSQLVTDGDAIPFAQFGRVHEWSVAISREEGQFRIPVFVGKNRLSLQNEWLQLQPEPQGVENPGRQLINVLADGELPEIVLKPQLGMVIEGIVTNAEGRPAAGATVWAENMAQPYSIVATRSDTEGRYRIEGISSEVKNMIAAVQGATSDRTVIEAKVVRPNDPLRRETVPLKLSPGIQLSGRVTWKGQPQSGIRIELTRSWPDQVNAMQFFSSTLTDDEGRYLLGSLSPGDRYHVAIKSENGLEPASWRYRPPYVTTVDPQATGVVELDEARLTSNQQSLSGVVVDPEGNPVPNIIVTARSKNGGTPRRTDPWPTTDADGRFQLVQLPNEKMELMAYKQNPAGGVILYPARAEPAMNQDDIRIVYDQTLALPVEDLDEK